MTRPLFLSIEDVIEIHADQIQRYGGSLQNHPFLDGNKRAGAMAAFVFLKLNGFTLEADESVFETLVLQAAQGQVGKAAIADFFRENTKS